MTLYTDEKQAQIVITLLRAHGIKHVIASPGTTNMALVGSIQTDPFFRIYSAVDERSAAYMACGLAAQLNNPVALSCTGATASRNYLPGLTEAFYRKLPVLAITSTQAQSRIGHHIAQVIDRSSPPNDVVKLSVDLPIVKDAEDIWDCEIKVNRAILELSRHGGGPVHINLPTTYSRAFNERELPEYRVINRWTPDDTLPALSGRVGVLVGAHRDWTAEETAVIERFCEVNNAAVFCDHTSGYHGNYRILGALIGGQQGADHSGIQPDISIHIGEITGDYDTRALVGTEVWRVSPDGEIRDTYRRLRHVFEMSEQSFFRAYSQGSTRVTSFFESCKTELEAKRAKLPKLPISNLWLASQLAHRIPDGSVIHFAILNSLRAWNFFELPSGVTSASNVGGFGIDGCMSSLIGAALADPDRLFFLVIGDLAFFYDMNVLGNRHLGPNVRILLVNNGKGTEFTQYAHPGSSLGSDADRFVAAEGHFGNKSRTLVKGYAEAIGLEYLPIAGKQDCETAFSRWLSSDEQNRSLLMEAFVDSGDESKALRMIKNLNPSAKNRLRNTAKDIVGAEKVRMVRRLLGK